MVQEYYRKGVPATDSSGWFETGDVCSIDKAGYIQITDRSKDVIKSGVGGGGALGSGVGG